MEPVGSGLLVKESATNDESESRLERRGKDLLMSDKR